MFGFHNPDGTDHLALLEKRLKEFLNQPQHNTLRLVLKAKIPQAVPEVVDDSFICKLALTFKTGVT